MKRLNLHNRMQMQGRDLPAQRSLRQTNSRTAARKGRTNTFTSVLPLRAGRYWRHFSAGSTGRANHAPTFAVM
ncbi:MAG: hypothetical protein LBV41_12715, partial [Cytophagaceae bacterium]|nr:hypothetical protein [Cytophagaceae bacterium]